MNQLKEGKALGLDGFTTTFFHSFWDLLKEEVWQVVEESHTLHWLLPSLNSTFIALIPRLLNLQYLMISCTQVLVCVLSFCPTPACAMHRLCVHTLVV